MKEGADMLMVKPGLPYLDIIRDVKNKVCINRLVCQFVVSEKPKKEPLVNAVLL